MISTIQKWASFVRFSHTVFALPFALAAMLVAARDNRGWPGWKTFGLILAAMVFARTCAMAFNRIVDRKFDALNPRTAKRHLPSGEISLFSAISLCLISAGGFDCRQLFSKSSVLLSFAGRAHRGLFLFADETVHRLHAHLSRHRARACSRRRMACGARSKCFRLRKFCR
jgi:4-hydroxybenzoate polyprenyltransferase